MDRELEYVEKDDVVRVLKMHGVDPNAIAAVRAMKKAAVVNDLKAWWKVCEVSNHDGETPIAWECSNCDEIVEYKYNFCPDCGADMRRSDERIDSKGALYHRYGLHMFYLVWHWILHWIQQRAAGHR